VCVCVCVCERERERERERVFLMQDLKKRQKKFGLTNEVLKLRY